MERTFLEKLDFYTPKLLALFEMKGGVAGIRIRHLLDSLSQLKCKFCLQLWITYVIDAEIHVFVLRKIERLIHHCYKKKKKTQWWSRRQHHTFGQDYQCKLLFCLYFLSFIYILSLETIQMFPKRHNNLHQLSFPEVYTLLTLNVRCYLY